MDLCIFCLSDDPPIDIYKGICNCHPPIHIECINTWYNTHPNTCPICLIKNNPENIINHHNNRLYMCILICFLYCMFLFWGPLFLIWIVIGLSRPEIIHHHHHHYKNITIINS